MAAKTRSDRLLRRGDREKGGNDNTENDSHKAAGSKFNLMVIKKKNNKKQVQGIRVVNLTATNSWPSTLPILFGVLFLSEFCKGHGAGSLLLV